MKRNTPKSSPRYTKKSAGKNTKIEVSGVNKLDGVSVWIMYIFTLTDDLMDPVVNLLQWGAIVIPGVGQALSAVITALSTGATWGIIGILFLYCHFNGISTFSKKVAKRLLLLVLEMIPGISILPMSTVFFYLTIKAENISRQHKTMMKLVKKFKV